jgi:hypothetical protein
MGPVDEDETRPMSYRKYLITKMLKSKKEKRTDEGKLTIDPENNQ